MYSLKEERISKVTPFSVFADNKRIRNKRIEGKSFQATRSGKNLLPIAIQQTTTKNGITFISNGDGSYYLTGTATADTDILFELPFEVQLPNSTLYCHIRNDAVVGVALLLYSDTGGSSLSLSEINRIMTSPNLTNLNLSKIGVHITSGQTVDVKFTPSIELTSEHSEYEPYGTSPSPEYPSETQSVGDDVNLISSVTKSGNILYFNGATTSTDYVFKAGTYTFSYENINTTSLYIRKEGESSQSLGSNKTTTFTSDVAFNVWLYRSGMVDGEVSNIKLQKGTVATPYSEHGKGTVEIKQCGKNLFDASQIANSNIVIDDNGKTITMPISTLGGYTSTNVKLSQLCPNLKIGDFCFLYFKKNIESNYNNYIYLQGTNETWIINSSKVITQEMLNSTVIMYGNNANGGETEQVIITDFMITKENDSAWEQYKENSYVIQTAPLRSLPNGVCDTIEEDGIHRRVGKAIVSIPEIITLSNGNIAGVCYYRDKVYIGRNALICSNGIEDKNKPLTLKEGTIYENESNIIFIGNSTDTLETIKEKYDGAELLYELAEEVIEHFDEEQQAVINSMETFEGVNYFSLVGDLETTLTFDYNPQITEEIKKAFKYNIAKAYLEVSATDQSSGFQINEDNYLQSLDFDDCRYIEGEGVIGSCVAKELQGKFVNVDTSFDIENREIECFIGAETEDNITHYLRLGTFIVQKPENDNVKDNTSFDSLDYMIKFNKEYVHRMAKYLKTEDTDIYPDKQYYILNDSGVYEEVIVPHKEEISNYYELIDEYTLMQLLKDICEQCEVKLGTFNFRNADYLVHGNRFDSGVSCRDVLKAIAQAAFSWARINEYNELLLDFETSDTISEEIDYNEYYGLNFNDNYGPVNTIVLKNSQAEGENITIKNDDLINSAGGKNLLNISNDYKVTHWKQVPIILPIGEYVITWENIETNGELPSMLMLFYYEDGTNLARYISNDYPSKSLVLTAEKTINRVNIYSQTSYENSTDITTTFYNLMISKNGGEYEDFIPLGTKELAISDNPFAYSEETRKAIIQAGEAIYGFKYVPLSVETIGAAYLNCKDKLKIKNMQDADLETYVFDTKISYQGIIKSNIETLAMTDIETKYRYDGSLTTAQRRTEFRVDKAEQKITSLVKATTEQGEKLTEATQDLDGFKRTIIDKTDETNEKITTIEETVNGIVAGRTISGGQNLIKNSVGYFGNDFWQINSETEGTVLNENSTDVKQNSISGSALKLQAETIYQDIKEIKNGEYYLSFNYKKIIDTAIATFKINDLTINLTETDWKEETHLINVTSNNIKIEMTTDLNSSILITDLILTEGNLQVSWTQNTNESYTDTVQIGKGVRITATGSDTEFVAEASGITINNIETNNPVAEFTKYGTETQELVAHKDVKVADSLLIQKIGNQTWFSSL